MGVLGFDTCCIYDLGCVVEGTFMYLGLDRDAFIIWGAWLRGRFGIRDRHVMRL